MDIRLDNLPSYLNVKKTESSIEFNPQRYINQQIINEAKQIYNTILIIQKYLFNSIYTIEGGNSQERIGALLFVLQKLEIINSSEKPYNDDNGYNENTKSNQKNFAYKSFNLTTSGQKKQIDNQKYNSFNISPKFSSDNLYTRDSKYASTKRFDDSMISTNDDNDNDVIKEDEKHYSFNKYSQNTSDTKCQKYVPPKSTINNSRGVYKFDANKYHNDNEQKEESSSIDNIKSTSSNSRGVYKFDANKYHNDNEQKEESSSFDNIKSTSNNSKGVYKFNVNKYYNEKNASITTQSKFGESYVPSFSKDRLIESVDDALKELKWKQNPKITKLDDKMYDELETFDRIVNFMVHEHLEREDKVRLYIEICKTFSLPQLSESTNKMKKSSIYSIFFDNKQFKLSDHFNDVFIEIFQDRIKNWELKSIFAFFRTLISISSRNTEMLSKEIDLLKRMPFESQEIHEEVEDLIKYIEARKQDEINSLESSVTPTPQDLFFANQTISNSKGKEWDNFIDYKQSLIDLTKENFYLPCRINLNKLREGTLDARDLFLYQNVKINFSTDINSFKNFKDCNLFLQFEIRIPPNWKKGIQPPDWRHSERLANRSLLILSTHPNLIKFDAVCKSCAAARGDSEISKATIQLLNKGIVPVTLISGEIKDDQSYYMFEPTSSWSSVQPVLQRLNKMREETFPKKFIDIITKLNFESNSEPEESLIPTEILLIKNNVPDIIKFTYLYNADADWKYDSWEDRKKDTELKVDHEQYKALRYALTHNLTLVNGAPGTGKTHLAREYLRIMNSIDDMKPIAIITFTNHALDSILEGVIDFVDLHKIVRWGGPMRSNNERLQITRWSNWHLERHIQSQRDNLATEKQKLKNMYNIRQMAVIYIDKIQKNPDDIQLYKTIINFLDNFLKATDSLNAKYPIGFTEEEVEKYREHQRSFKKGIEIHPLPSRDDSINCWFYGKDYFERRNNELKRVYDKNEKIFNTKYENQFEGLNQNEEEDNEEEEEDASNNNKNDSDENANSNNENINSNNENTNSNDENTDLNNESHNSNENQPNSKENNNNNDNNNDDDKEEEEDKEEEKLDENMFGDLDMIEENKNSYLNSKISDDLPRKYFDVLSDNFTELMNSDKSPSKSMIEFLRNIYSPLTQWINKKEEEVAKDEVSFAEDETLSAGKYLSNMKLIGMTSTVASCRKEALERAGVEIVIVEEAGELTESMLSCILPKTMKRLILIGDYQQLRPKVEHEMTFEPYNYDISLFEKLVCAAQEKNAECLFTLSIQRRMHPQISQLVRNVFYKSGKEKITDDESTNLLGKPFGMPHRVRFYLHNFEIQSTTTRSYANVEEAKYCASLIPFFICRGYKPKDITIIALYKGQKYEIEKQIDELFMKRDQKIDSMDLYDSLGNARSSRDFKVVVLDNFQGEENKIIIVSLTRSDKPGFIKNRNRALVTLSRAREMLVVLGNKNIFGKKCQNNELWKRISEEAEKLSPYSMSTDKTPGIIVNQCNFHNDSHNHDNYAILKTPDKIIKYRFSYCKVKCNYKLQCGHNCQLACHCHFDPPREDEHDDYYCPFRCEKRCPNHHQCRGICGNCFHYKCPDCIEIVHHVFPCGHEADIQCYLETSGKAECHAKCGKKLDRCDHTCNLPCGHSGKCDCLTRLDAVCPNCNRSFKHYCGKPAECPKYCNYSLPCGHKCTQKCIDCIKYGHIKECQEQCNFVFQCGHHCPHKCCDKFPEHHHLYCQTKIELPLKIGQVIKKEQECSNSIPFDLFKPHKCYQCNKKWFNRNKYSTLERCTCQCNKKCPECGKRCRALDGEKCAIFCPHSANLKNIKEPPKDKGLVFLFHDNHFLFVDEAIEKVKIMYENMMLGKGENAVPIHRLTCPIDGCSYIEPCMLDSLLFESLNCEIESILKRIREISSNELNKKDNDDIHSYDKIFWYNCSQCQHLFYSFVDDPINSIIKCPNCGYQKGDMFE